MVIECSIQELMLADMLAKTEVTSDLRSKFTDEEIKEVLKVANEKIRERGWFENKSYSEEFINLTKYLKLFTIANKELVLNNLVYRYRRESEEGILLSVSQNDRVRIGIITKSEYFVYVVKGCSVMMDNVDEIGHHHDINEMLRKSLLDIKPEVTISHLKDDKIIEISIIRKFEGRILEEELVSNKFKSVNSKYLRDKLLSFLEVSYE